MGALPELRILIHTNASQYDQSVVGGAETSLRLIAEKLAEKGHRVDYVARNRQKKLPSLKVQRINGVDVYLFSPLCWPSKFLHHLDPIKKIWTRKQFSILIGKIIQRHHVQIVHTFSEFPSTYDILQLRKRNPHFKVVLRIAGLFWYKQCQGNPDLIRKIEYVFNAVDSLAFISEGLEKLFEEHTKLLGMNISNTHRQVLEIGTDNKFFENKWQKGQSDKFRLMMVGRLEFPKRQDILIDAIQLLNNKKIELHFFGDGPEKTNLFKKAQNDKIQDQIHFHGIVPQENIAKFLAQADLFCHASDYEGLCKSVLEAMRVGTPALVSDVMSLNTYIIDGTNGYLVENTSHSWASKINAIIADQKQLEKISDNEIKFAKQNYSPENNVSNYIDTFQSLVNDIN